MVLLFPVYVSVLPFSIPYLSSNTTLVKIFGKGIEGVTRDGSGSDVYEEQTDLVLAIQAAHWAKEFWMWRLAALTVLCETLANS